MIRLEYHANLCKKGCTVCEKIHPGIRELSGLDQGHYTLSLSEWRHVQETVMAAVRACKTGAINWVDERGEWT